MCTCITYENGGFYFGRNLDLDVSFGQTVTVTPEKFPLNFRKTKRAEKHYAMVGMASDNDAFPLYAEAVNEKGLSMAGLNFPGNAYYQKVGQGEHELASFEVIPWVLGTCASVAEAEDYLRKTEIVDLVYDALVHDQVQAKKLDKCFVIEVMKERIDDSDMEQIMLQTEVKRKYRHDLLDYFLFVLFSIAINLCFESKWSTNSLKKTTPMQ